MDTVTPAIGEPAASTTRPKNRAWPADGDGQGEGAGEAVGIGGAGTRIVVTVGDETPVWMAKGTTFSAVRVGSRLGVGDAAGWIVAAATAVGTHAPRTSAIYSKKRRMERSSSGASLRASEFARANYYAVSSAL